MTRVCIVLTLESIQEEIKRAQCIWRIFSVEISAVIEIDGNVYMLLCPGLSMDRWRWRELWQWRLRSRVPWGSRLKYDSDRVKGVGACVGIICLRSRWQCIHGVTGAEMLQLYLQVQFNSTIYLFRVYFNFAGSVVERITLCVSRKKWLLLLVFYKGSQRFTFTEGVIADIEILIAKSVHWAVM